MALASLESPTSPREVLNLVEAGKLAPPAALAILSRLRSEDGPRFDESAERRRRLERIQAELDELVGLEHVKRLVREVTAFVEIRRWRAREGLATEQLVLHMIFSGNPGTGKTTVARLLGRLFKEMGVLEKGHLVEVERADLVGEYIGHTAQRTRDQIKKALGGILFVDEAYALARGGEKDFGKEAIDTLVKAMEDHRDQMVLVMAGYPREMRAFVQANPGVSSRFPIHLEFPDYSTGDLLRIAERLTTKRQYRLSPEARAALAELVARYRKRYEENRGNARFMRNLVEAAVRMQALRLYRRGGIVSRGELELLTEDDFAEADRHIGKKGASCEPQAGETLWGQGLGGEADV